MEPALFRQICAFAHDRYPEDKESYHVSAELSRFPTLADIPDEGLPAILDDEDALQVLHVTFGSQCARFGLPMLTGLTAQEETYAGVLKRRFRRHLAPFI